MSTNTKISKNGKTYEYYRITRTIGHKYVDGRKVGIKKQFTGTSKANAERKYKLFLENQRKNSESIIDTIKTFEELADYYIENILMVNSTYSIGTRKLYSDSYKSHIKGSELARKLIATLKPEDIQVFYNSLNISKSALSTLNKFMKGFITWANINKYCDCNLNAIVIPEKKVIRKQKEIVVWTDSEIQNIMDSEPDYVLKDLIVFALYSGMRISELLGLKWEDLYNDCIHVNRQYYRGDFVLPKMGKTRVIPMHKNIKELVRDKNEESGLVFYTKSGTPLDYHNVIRSLGRFYRRNDIAPKKFHAYRATFITRLCQNGVPIQVASKLAGHENISVTAKYYTSIEIDTMSKAIDKI